MRGNARKPTRINKMIFCIMFNWNLSLFITAIHCRQKSSWWLRVAKSRTKWNGGSSNNDNFTWLESHATDAPRSHMFHRMNNREHVQNENAMAHQRRARVEVSCVIQSRNFWSVWFFLFIFVAQLQPSRSSAERFHVPSPATQTSFEFIE